MLVIAAAVSLVGAGVANASRVNDTNPAAYVSGSESIGPRTFNGTGFEASEGYNLGTCSAQNGWRSFGANNPTPPGPRDPDTSINDLKLESGKTRTLLLDENASFPTGTNIGCFTPRFKNAENPRLNLDIKVDDVLGANYLLNPQAPTQGFSTARAIFYYDGDTILILDDLDGPGPGGLSFQTAAFNYDPGVWYTYEFEMDVANSRVRHYIGPDKNNLQLIYDAYMWGGTLIEELVLFSDNFQRLGGGSVTGQGPAGAYIDNILSKPEPSTLALLAIGGLALIRRRK